MERAPSGAEWIVDAIGCDPARLRSLPALQDLFARAVTDLGLRPMGDAVWHVFPESGGVTGFVVLSESHLACHTFPETGHAAFNLYCCRPRPDWPWEERLREGLGAAAVRVTRLARGPA